MVEIHDRILSVLETYKPSIAVVESIFYDKNINSAFKLGHVRGVILYLLAKMGIEIFEYSPREIKKSVVGNGNASKEQIKFMLEKSLNLTSLPNSFDATDALAAALCHYNKIRYEL